MKKIEIRIWNAYNVDKSAWIQIDNSNLDNIWDCIKDLKINKNKITTFYVELCEGGFTYNIHYKIKNYKRFINKLIKKFKRLENYCPILIRDMEAEKDYKIGKKYPPFPFFIEDSFIKGKK